MYMDKFGIENVRGGSCSQTDLTDEQIASIMRQLINANDICYVCRQSGHYMRDCRMRIGAEIRCSRCARTGHTVERCYASTHSNGHYFCNDNIVTDDNTERDEIKK